jgi:hypothetical protein
MVARVGAKDRLPARVGLANQALAARLPRHRVDGPTEEQPGQLVVRFGVAFGDFTVTVQRRERCLVFCLSDNGGHGRCLPQLTRALAVRLLLGVCDPVLLGFNPLIATVGCMPAVEGIADDLRHALAVPAAPALRGDATPDEIKRDLV